MPGSPGVFWELPRDDLSHLGQVVEAAAVGAGDDVNDLNAVGRNAKDEGDVLHDTLAIEPGARLEGRCLRLDKADADDPKLDLLITDVDRNAF